MNKKRIVLFLYAKFAFKQNVKLHFYCFLSSDNSCWHFGAKTSQLKKFYHSAIDPEMYNIAAHPLKILHEGHRVIKKSHLNFSWSYLKMSSMFSLYIYIYYIHILYKIVINIVICYESWCSIKIQFSKANIMLIL